MVKSNANKAFSLSIKVTITVVALLYIAYKLRLRGDELGRWFSTDAFFSSQAWLWFPIILLAALNWFTEAAKWQYLASYVEQIPLRHALKSVLAGVTLGVATPNRTGEFAGRVFFLEQAGRGEALVLAAVGSFAQFLVTVLAGVIGFLFLRKENPFGIFDDQFLVWTMLLLLFTLVLVFLLLLFVEAFRLIIFNLPGLKLFKKYVNILSVLNRGGHAKVFGYSLLRYAIYATQFVLLLRLCGATLSISEAYALVAVTFFAVTVVPTFAFTEVAVRGSAAVAFIGGPAGDETAALTASLLLWLINIILPALAGIVFVFQLRFFRDKPDAPG